MAKLRRNHSKSGNVMTTAFIRVIAFLFIMAFGLFYFNRYLTDDQGGQYLKNGVYEIPYSNNPNERFYLPEGGSGQIIHHDYFSLSYQEEHEQAEWVAYELRKDQLKVPNVPREKEFRPDKKVKSFSAVHSDYTNSGYTRGHLVPAGDMAFSREAMEQSFYMSNMSPQLYIFNDGIWRELEEQIREWAYRNERLFVVTGPVFENEVSERIGVNKISVPSHFFKIVLDLHDPEYKGIGFLIPHEYSEIHLNAYVVSIDSIETVTGLDFFSDLLSETMEVELESKVEHDKWNYDAQKFKYRNKRVQGNK